MPKSYPIPHCSEKDRQLVDEWAKSRTIESRLVEKAKIIKRCLQGDSVKKVAQELGVRPNTVITWRRRFDMNGIAGLPVCACLHAVPVCACLHAVPVCVQCTGRLERATGYVVTDSRKVVRGFKSTYRRHGILNLFAALEVATGAIHT